MTCDCLYHRYHAVHVYQERLYDHSQETFDALLRRAPREQIETFNSALYRHGMTAHELRAAAGPERLKAGDLVQILDRTPDYHGQFAKVVSVDPSGLLIVHVHPEYVPIHYSHLAKVLPLLPAREVA
jgi:hypothetical protein